MKPASRLWRVLALLLLALGAVRFVRWGFLLAMDLRLGDFRASFPTAYFAGLRPDFPTDQVWPGWTYGPMVHFMTLPLFLVPRWSLVGPVWALVNLVALAASFVYACRLSGVARHAPATAYIALAGLWLWFKPLNTCFEQGNVELVEMALTLAALVGVTRGREHAPGVLLGIATMIKGSPVGFLGWLGLRGQWRTVKAGVATILVIAVMAHLTLGFQNNTLALKSLWDRGIPQVSADTQAVTSIFLHRAGVVDHSDSYFPQRWFPTSRATVAARAGQLACVLLAIAYGLLLIRRRHRPVSPIEVSALFIPMLLLLTSNHQYYFVFALVPVSVLFLRSVVAQQRRVLVVTLTAYLMMSSPFPFTWIDRAGWFGVPFFYVLHYANVMAYGALLVWATATYLMLAEPDEAPARVEGRRAVRRLGWIAAAATAVLLVVAFRAYSRRATGSSSSVVTLDRPILYSQPAALALSPDGRQLAFIAEGQILCTRPLTGATATCWTGADAAEASGPFFSPDGRWIGFFSRGDLRKVPAAGGAVGPLSGGPVGQTARWETDDTIVYAAPYGIVQLARAKGVSDLLVSQRLEDGQYLSPVLTPGGEAVLFTIAPSGGARGAGTIVAQSLKTGRRVMLVPGSQPYFDAATRRLLYVYGGRVMAVAFDPATLSIDDLSVPVIHDVLVTAKGGAQFAVSASGTLVYLPEARDPDVRRTLVWVDRQGTQTPLPIVANAFESPRISRDGRRLAVAIRDVLTDVWIYDLAAGTSTRIATPANRNDTPVWMPHNEIAFAAAGTPVSRSGVLSSKIRDGGRVWTTLWRAVERDRQPIVRLSSSSPDGLVLAGTLTEDEGMAALGMAGQLWFMDVTPPGPRITVIRTPFNEQDPALSPDGRWVAYASERTGKAEIYVQPFPTLTERWRVSENGGMQPRWSADGRELFYRSWDQGSGKPVMRAVPVTTRGAFTAGSPQALFEEGPRPGPSWGTSYDVAPDGQRFLIVREDAPVSGNAVRVVQRWPAVIPR